MSVTKRKKKEKKNKKQLSGPPVRVFWIRACSKCNSRIKFEFFLKVSRFLTLNEETLFYRLKSTAGLYCEKDISTYLKQILNIFGFQLLYDTSSNQTCTNLACYNTDVMFCHNQSEIVRFIYGTSQPVQQHLSCKHKQTHQTSSKAHNLDVIFCCNQSEIVRFLYGFS